METIRVRLPEDPIQRLAHYRWARHAGVILEPITGRYPYLCVRDHLVESEAGEVIHDHGRAKCRQCNAEDSRAYRARKRAA